MTVSELIMKLHSLSESDVQDLGEDVDGNPIFAIKINKNNVFNKLFFFTNAKKNYFNNSNRKRQY